MAPPRPYIHFFRAGDQIFDYSVLLQQQRSDNHIQTYRIHALLFKGEVVFVGQGLAKVDKNPAQLIFW